MSFEGYRHAGDIQFESITLLLSDGTSINIENLVKEISIFQDLFGHYMECEIVVDDSVGLFAQGNSGAEVVNISYRNAVGPGVDKEYTRHIFNVYEISDRKRISEFREVYIMNCISPEFYLTSPLKISRSYTGTVSEMITKIKDEFVYNDIAKGFYGELRSTFDYVLDKESKAVIDPTLGKHKFVIPNMPVDDAIDFLTNEADSDDHIPFFTFYEDINGFNFRNISSLINQETISTYHYFVMRTEEPANDNNKPIEFDDTYNIISYNILRQSNILDNLSRGLFRSKTINLDVLKKVKRETIYDYDEYADKFTKIENKILGGSEGDPIVTLITSRTGHDSCQCPLFRLENHLPKRINETTAARKGYQKSIFNLVLEVIIPGNAELKVGDKIELMFYHTLGNSVRLENYDKYLSGHYLITKMRQKIAGGKTGSNFVSVMECTKDGIME